MCYKDWWTLKSPPKILVAISGVGKGLRLLKRLNSTARSFLLMTVRCVLARSFMVLARLAITRSLMSVHRWIAALSGIALMLENALNCVVPLLVLLPALRARR